MIHQRFAQDTDGLRSFLYDLIIRCKKEARSLVRMLFRERVATYLGVLDHDSPTAGQYALIKYNENEHVMDELYGSLFERYIGARVLHYTGIPWDRFYKEHEYWESEEIIDRCLKMAKEDAQDANALANRNAAEVAKALEGNRKKR